ncbi:MAG: hypothetical protein UY10_C0032G0007 [Microgenomates group bacterium GW2011_GWA2_47_8]|nr:MAG: hypothetical protein UY10_C0032G0007 [Microgenomates group bacterium GW2011_GWA2_47_8]
MKSKTENKQEYKRLAKLVDKAERKAVEFVRKNLSLDSELRLKYPTALKVSLR